MGKKLLAIVEVSRGSDIVKREVVDVLDLAADIAGARDWNLTQEGRTPWRNGWQYEIAGSVHRVSFERCHADEVERTIAAVTV